MKFQPSAIAATNLSKKSGGTVATITNIFRRKNNPRQPRTTAQTAARAALTSLSTSWGTLTEAQQDAWISAAPNEIKVKHGEAYSLKGNTYFIEVNRNIITAGGTIITTPPVPVALPSMPMLPYITGDLEVSDGIINYQWGLNAPYLDLPTDPWIGVIYWNKWKKPGVNSLGKPSTLIPSANFISANSVIAFFTESDTNGTDTPIGQGLKSNVEIVYINKNTGQRVTFLADRMIADTYDNLNQPYIPGSNISNQEDTGTPPDETIVVTYTAETGTYDFSTWKPFFFMSEWIDESLGSPGPINIQIPDSAITLIDDMNFTITFGPADGNAPGPTAETQNIGIMIGWQNVETGFQEWEGETVINN